MESYIEKLIADTLRNAGMIGAVTVKDFGDWPLVGYADSTSKKPETASSADRQQVS